MCQLYIPPQLRCLLYLWWLCFCMTNSSVTWCQVCKTPIIYGNYDGVSHATLLLLPAQLLMYHSWWLLKCDRAIDKEFCHMIPSHCAHYKTERLGDTTVMIVYIWQWRARLCMLIRRESLVQFTTLVSHPAQLLNTKLFSKEYLRFWIKYVVCVSLRCTV